MAQDMIAQGLAGHAARLIEVMVKNPDFPRRLIAERENVNVSMVDNWFRLIIGEPEPAETVSLDDLLLFRVDPQSARIVGLEIPDLEACAREMPGAMIFVLGLLMLASGQFEGEPSDAAALVEKGMRKVLAGVA